jgi:23S rRNA (cytidine1920-2'-O)/16S rRNA (cytidine1409-2'-O)-methyltransferase
MNGKVLVDGQPVTKSGTKLKTTAKIEIIAKAPKYVCRGGLKLEKALEEFGISCEGKVALDSGLSTVGGLLRTRTRPTLSILLLLRMLCASV